MTLSNLFEEALSMIGSGRNGPEAFDLSCLMEQVCGAGRYELPLRGGTEVPPEQMEHFFSLVDRWRRGEPLQYLLGKWEFYGLPFFVGPGVLIPRQDTETLADEAIRFLRNRLRPVVADLCAGSGCLAGAIARYTPEATVVAVELSEAALPYLKKNIMSLDVAVQILHGDVCAPPALPPLDLAVCNPPYISCREMETLADNVRWEPKTALFGGEDGYDFYRVLPGLYMPMLKPGGALMFETGYQQARTVAELMEQAGFGQIRIIPDAAGIQRVVAGQTPA